MTFTPSFMIHEDGETYEVAAAFALEGLQVPSGTAFNISVPRTLRRFKALRQAKPLLLASCVHDLAIRRRHTWEEASAYFYLGLRASGWANLSACLLTGVVYLWGYKNHHRAPQVIKL